MRKIFWTIACFAATPVYAADGSAYAGIEGGVLLPRNLSGDIAVTIVVVFRNERREIGIWPSLAVRA